MTERCIPDQLVPAHGHDRGYGGSTGARRRGRQPSPSAPRRVPFRGGRLHAVLDRLRGRRAFREILAPLELEPREFALLRAVAAAEGQSQQAIGERLQIPPSRMVAFVDALEERSLLERRHNPHDRRTRELHLTDAGRELLERAFALAVGVRARSVRRAQRRRARAAARALQRVERAARPAAGRARRAPRAMAEE